MDNNRSSKLPLQKNKNQFSCIWGLADMFDFRNGRTNQKLLSNGRAMYNHSLDAEHLRKVDKQAQFCEKCQEIEDGCKIKVKDIMQEEFPTEKQLKKLLKAIKQQRTITDFGCVHQLASNHKKAIKSSQKASQMPIDNRNEKMQLGSYQCSRAHELSLDSHNFGAMLEEIYSQIHEDGRWNGDIPTSISPSRFKQLDEINLQLLQMSAKAFIDQIYINRRYNGRDAAIGKSKPFSDASEILHLNRDIFLKVLHDPNSLLVKHIQKLQFPKRETDRIKLLLNSKFSEGQSSAMRNHEDPEYTMRIQKKNMNNHLWKKLKNRCGFSFKGSSCSSANEIVVLQPASKSKKNPENVSCHCSALKPHQSFNNKGKNIKSTHFSFKDIKRKFKQAVGESQKEHHLISVGDNRLSRNRDSLTWADIGIGDNISTRGSSISKDYKRKEKQQKPTGLISCNGPEIEFNNEALGRKLNSPATRLSNKDEFDIFMEAKRHLSERLKSVNAGDILPRKQTPRTLEMVLSLPDSPKRDTSAFISAQMRLSVYNNMEKGKGVSCQSLQKQNKEVPPSTGFRSDDQSITSESKPNLPENIHDGNEMHDIISAAGDDLKHSGHASILEEHETMLPDTLTNLEVSYETSMVDSTYSGQSIETSEPSEDNGDEECSSLAESSEDHHRKSLVGSSSTPLDISALKMLDSCKDREGHPSPVSVLEPFSPEDINSPTSIAPEPAGSPLQPRRIDFDDHLHVEPTEDPKIDVASCMEGEDYISAYVRAVMQASELNFEELSSNSPSLAHALDSYMFNSVGLFQVGSNCDLNLLLDCIHEVLVGVYYNYFGCSPWLSFLKSNVRSAPQEANVVDLVVKEVNYYLNQEMRQPTLDQLVGKDTAKSGSWLQLHPHTEDLVIQIAEDVLQDSMVDTILEFQI